MARGKAPIIEETAPDFIAEEAVAPEIGTPAETETPAEPEALTPDQPEDKDMAGDVAPGALPPVIVLTCPYGFIDEDEVTHMWGANQVITDAAEIALLIELNVEHTVPE
jgi:hypothetical protein